MLPGTEPDATSLMPSEPKVFDRWILRTGNAMGVSVVTGANVERISQPCPPLRPYQAAPFSSLRETPWRGLTTHA